MSPTGEKIYEMLWDCEYCGTRKLLGKSQRHCPVCGAAQNPEKRYFPAENEKIAVRDHPYVGADLRCGACQAANSAAARFCAQCGAPLEGAATVKLVQDGAATPGAPAAVPAVSPKQPAKRFKKRYVFLGIGLLIVAAFFAAALWQKDIAITAAGHTWQREIRIENFLPRTKHEWCDQMPGDAYSVTRSREVRSHRQVANGQTCRTKRTDRGDGTYSEHQECTTKYRSEPVYDDKCHFTVNRWEYARSITAQGRSLAETPYWPQVALSRVGTNIGSEREGQRFDKYTVFFNTAKGTTATCDFKEDVWRSLPVGSRWNAKIGVVTGILDCATLGKPTPEAP